LERNNIDDLHLHNPVFGRPPSYRYNRATPSTKAIHEEFVMPICHEHNLAEPLANLTRYGIRVKLRSTDPFKKLVGDNWNKEHWFATARERDEAFTSMSGRYIYFRPGDQPALNFEKIERS
jgi:hypothetical protein